MKKFISFIMAAAMVVSLVPSVAFAKDTNGTVTTTAKVVAAAEVGKDASTLPSVIDGSVVPEVQIKVTSAEYATAVTGVTNKATISVSLEGAKFSGLTAANITIEKDGAALGGVTISDWSIFNDNEELEFAINGNLVKDYVIHIPLKSDFKSVSVNKTALVSVDSDDIDVNLDNAQYGKIIDKGIKASVKKTVDIASEELTELNSNGIKVEATTGTFVVGQVFELKLSSGFEFTKLPAATNTDITAIAIDGNSVKFEIATAGLKEFTLKGIEIEAVSAKTGSTATITVKALKENSVGFAASASVEVAKVVDYTVKLSVDEDEDVPVIYSGTNVENYGLTDDSDHLTLTATIEESFKGAWSNKQATILTLPEGVYVTGVKIGEVKIDGFTSAQIEEEFAKAYKKGDYESFEFAKRIFGDPAYAAGKAKIEFQLELVADPSFEGDVELTLEGSLIDTQKVTAAKFVKPYTVKAEQNDVIIDYRQTEIKTPIVFTETEEGLFAKDKAEFTLVTDKSGVIQFEDGAKYSLNDSGLELKDAKTTTGSGRIDFKVKKSSSDGAAVVTISDLKLFMERNIPAGAYSLKVQSSLADAFVCDTLLNPTTGTITNKYVGDLYDAVGPVELSGGYFYFDRLSTVAKEGFINVVTSGRDNDNLFTTKVVVPVGESYLIAGNDQIALDVPAYISNGYTMLPLRAVSKALGVNTNNVVWNNAARTVTIMYGQRVITLTIGATTMYVNGSPVPASSAPEIKDGRTFLPLRDLGTALGVTAINWDAATRTATLN